MFKLAPKEQKLLILVAALLALGIVLRLVLPVDLNVAGQKSGGSPPVKGITGEGTPVNVSPAAAAALEDNMKVEEKNIIVHVTGAVSEPGIYHLPAESRVYEALELAGGGLDEADLERINLAQPLVDGQQVFVPLKGEEGAQPLAGGSQTAGRININTADQSQLESLPGIGAVKATSILNYRQQNGPFHSIDELTQVSGIGAKTLEGIKELITVW